MRHWSSYGARSIAAYARMTVIVLLMTLNLRLCTGKKYLVQWNMRSERDVLQCLTENAILMDLLRIILKLYVC